MENFFGKEKERYDEFKKHHYCPDKKAFDRFDRFDRCEFDVKLYYSFGSGIGRNTIVECQRCFCKQDITDYGEW